MQLSHLPVLFIHPLRVKRLRPLNIALTAIWCALAILTLWLDFSPPVYVTAALCVIGIYFLLAGMLRRRQSAKA